MSRALTDGEVKALFRQLVKAAGGVEACGVELGIAHQRLFGDSKKLDALIAGSDIQVRRYEGAMVWLSGNWPEAVDWPEGVVRPHGGGSLSSAGALVAPGVDHGAEKSAAVFSPAEDAA